MTSGYNPAQNSPIRRFSVIVKLFIGLMRLKSVILFDLVIAVTMAFDRKIHGFTDVEYGPRVSKIDSLEYFDESRGRFSCDFLIDDTVVVDQVVSLVYKFFKC